MICDALHRKFDVLNILIILNISHIKFTIIHNKTIFSNNGKPSKDKTKKRNKPIEIKA